MNPNPNHREDPAGESLHPEVLEALRRWDAAPAGPAAATEAAIAKMATARMAMVRRRAVVRRAVIGIGALAACLALALVLAWPANPSATPDPVASAAPDPAAIILQEVSAVFPGQIRSILSDQSGLQLSLADAPFAHSGRAVVLNIKRDGRSHEIITFSGQTVEIMGHPVIVHASDDGNIILKGQHIEWFSQLPTQPLPGLQIHARSI